MPNQTKQIDLSTLAAHYNDAESARNYLEGLRWPNGAVCPHCEAIGAYKLEGKAGSRTKARKGLWKCKTCWRQFTVTVGTIFEGSKLPLNKWLIAFFILGSAKKAVSAHQMSRMLGIGYKASWFMCHRIRHAMKPESPRLLKGVVEVDETFIGPRSNIREKHSSKVAAVALVERGGEVRTKVVNRVTTNNIKIVLNEFVDKSAKLNTDNNAAYKAPAKAWEGHEVVSHAKGEFTRKSEGERVSVNSCESFFSLLKRGIVGSFHHISAEHLPRYCDEFSFRWNTRKLTDGQRFVTALGMVKGKRLTYKTVISN